MVLLTVTAAAKAAIEQYSDLVSQDANKNDHLTRLRDLDVGSPIEHEDLIAVSISITQVKRNNAIDGQKWRLDGLLRGASVYQPPPPPKTEPTPQYKALMQRLKREEEERQYERMVNPQPAHETSSTGAYAFNAATSIGQGPDANEVDEITYADFNRQMALIINVLVSIIACSVAIWIAARRWSVPQRMALSMSGSCLVAVAEVAIYMGYIRRVKDAREVERKVVETKEIVDSWVLDGNSSSLRKARNDGMRLRKGKHR